MSEDSFALGITDAITIHKAGWVDIFFLPNLAGLRVSEVITIDLSGRPLRLIHKRI